MPSINMIRTSFSIIAITFLVTASSNSITSPDVCLSDLDCSPTTFCNGTVFSQVPSCVPRLPESAVCENVGLSECQDGLTCIFDDSKRVDGPSCQRRVPRGAQCRLDATRPCVRDLICDRNNTTCQPFTDGFASTPCEIDSHCQQDKGFYCQKGISLCSPKKEPGRECGIPFPPENFECLGFCVSQSFDDGRCVSARKEGQLCTDDSQCENLFFRDFGRFPRRSNPLICNRLFGFIGRCIRESRLINRLGAKCDPNHNRCDARRGLSCRPTRSGRHVCQHRNSRFDRLVVEYCEPRSRFSQCAWRNEKRECRLERRVPGKSLPSSLSPFFECRRKSERVSRGGVCITEYAACTRGTECRLVPGVKPGPDTPFILFPPPRVSYCVHIAEENEFCGNVNDKFTTQCAKGLRCEKGKCVKVENNDPSFDETETHIGLGALCSSLPCAPGLVCDNTEFDPKKRCMLPLKVVGRGRPCTDRAVERRRCKDGLVCAFGRDGANVKRCRKPRKAGDYCQDDDECADGLICPVGWTRNREQEERRCYDPKTTLEIGDECDPKASASQPRCVENKRTDPSGPGLFIREPMRCVPKGDGFACRIIKGLFEVCNEANDVACDIRQKCGNLGVCVPVGET